MCPLSSVQLQTKVFTFKLTPAIQQCPSAACRKVKQNRTDQNGQNEIEGKMKKKKRKNQKKSNPLTKRNTFLNRLPACFVGILLRLTTSS
jgi:hypothetical protein